MGTEDQQVQLTEAQQSRRTRKQGTSVDTGGQVMACLSPRKLAKGRESSWMSLRGYKDNDDGGGGGMKAPK